MSERINIIQVSGGKDSTAVLIYAKQRGIKFTAIFNDTGWEHPITYAYLEYLEKALDIQIVRIKPKMTFLELALYKKRFPSTKARFCTSFLKVIPFTNWLLKNITGDVWVWQGIRAQESAARASMNVMDDYFKMRKGDYGIRKIRAWLEGGSSAMAYRPIFNLTADEVFELHKLGGVEPNPLYKMGFKRVGCMPCIMCNHSEIKLIAEKMPEVLEKLRDAEKQVGRTFFPPAYIAGLNIATVDEVVAYMQSKVNPNQIKLFEKPVGACQSVYNICE